MRIRQRSRNRYLRTADGLWVRDLTAAAPAVDINPLTAPADRELLVANEVANSSGKWQTFEPRFSRHVCVVSDGHGFDGHRDLLEGLPPHVTIVGVNRSLARWKVPGRAMSHYLATSPYDEALGGLPTAHRYFPPCLASVRTCPQFLRRYRGQVHLYRPAREEGFGGSPRGSLPVLDEYRNPVCAAVSLAYLLGATKILLFCCDDSFADERPGAERLPNGLWSYPQHRIPHGLVDGMLHWVTRQEERRVVARSFSHGRDFANAPYIPAAEVAGFFAG